MRRIVPLLVFLCFQFLHAEGQAPPNVIVILTDDQGSVDLGIYGSQDLQTPHLDQLAQRGIRFTQFYAGSPVCSPSRAALLTGKVPHRAGVPANAGSERGGPRGLPPEQITMAEIFQGAGYATAHIGKWHLGYTPEKMPNSQGFDHSFGHMGGCIDNYSHFFYWNGPNRHDLHRNGEEIYRDGAYFPDLMVQEALHFIDAHQDQPFFIYFALNTPHYPYQGDTSWLRHYREKGVSYPRDLYNAFVSSLDDRIGRLLDKIESLGMTENTIVVFQSDHGHSTEERAHFGGGNAGPYRGAKFSLFEGGIRVPAIISWPGHLGEGLVRNQVAVSCDWLPTLVELTGIDAALEAIDGRSLVSVFKDDAIESPHEHFHWQLGQRWAVRKGPWKLLYDPADTSFGNPAPENNTTDIYFLVNLDTDMGEKINVGNSHPEIVKQLTDLHVMWEAQWK